MYYTRKIRVMPSDVGADGKLKFRRFMDYLQDTAGIAAESFEGTTTELLDYGFAWVLAKYDINIHSDFPMIDTEITVDTWHDPNHGYNCLRMFETPFATAKSSWLLVDLKSGRPVKPLAHIPDIDEDGTPITPDFTEIPELTETVHTVKIPVMPHDLDYNKHVNNAVYFAWVLDNLPAEGTLTSVSASFRSGAKLGETLTLNYSRLNSQIVCRVFRPEAQKPCASFLAEVKD